MISFDVLWVKNSSGSERYSAALSEALGEVTSHETQIFPLYCTSDANFHQIEWLIIWELVTSNGSLFACVSCNAGIHSDI